MENPFLQIAEPATQTPTQASAQSPSQTPAHTSTHASSQAPADRSIQAPNSTHASAPAASEPLHGSPDLPARPRELEPDDWNAPRSGPAADQRLTVRDTGARAGTGGGDGDPLQRLSRKPDLHQHLREQLVSVHADRQVVELAHHLVDWLEDDGYLRESDEDLAEWLGVDTAMVAAARALLHECDPAGIGARDLTQCLRLQLAERDRLDPAMERLIDRLPTLAQADWNALERACRVDREDLEQMVAEIKALDPRPGLSFASVETEAVIPDIIVGRGTDGRWRIELNSATLPKVVIDRDYYTELSGEDIDGEARTFISERFQSASWLAKALEQRSRTILRVAKSVFSRQCEFLEHGPAALRPLVLRDIASATGLHESTVSRATNEKYAQTPHGTFSLKYFFTTALPSTEGGADHSAEAIRQRIKQMIRKETGATILSDDQIVGQLQTAGVSIARRTVAKYRESMGIQSSVHRRRAKALVG